MHVPVFIHVALSHTAACSPPLTLLPMVTGTLLILDAFPPSFWPMQRLLDVWLGWVVPRIVGLFSSQKAYQYLSHSIQNTVPASTVAAMLQSNGCAELEVSLYSFGAAGCILLKK